MLQIELESLLAGSSVIVIDTGSSHSKDELQKLISSDYSSRIFRISALIDGLDLKFLETFTPKNGLSETDFMLINTATQSLSQPLRLGPAQTATLRESIIFALKHKDDYNNEIEAIVAGLNRKGRQGQEIYSRLWAVFNCNALRSEHSKMVRPDKINIIDLNGYEEDVQKVLAEIILSYLLRIKHYQRSQCIYNVFLDEFQRFSLNNNGMIFQLLREGRKFGINLILATQTLSTLGKDTQAILSQTSTQLYFRPSYEDIAKIAKKLSPSDWQDWKTRLSSLRIGECIASGVFNINGQEINRPLLLR